MTRHSDRVCFVCAKPAVGLGYSPNPGRLPIGWVCSVECIQTARETYGMSAREFSRIDSMATIEGGDEAGAYLDSLGKSDLAALEEEEWHEFCRRLVGGYRAALEGKLRDEAPF